MRTPPLLLHDRGYNSRLKTALLPSILEWTVPGRRWHFLTASDPQRFTDAYAAEWTISTFH